MTRNYSQLAESAPASGTRTERMQAFVDQVWRAFETKDVSWVGFYLPDPENPDQLVLGPARNKPACSPIGLHGACGQAFVRQRPLVVNDVAALGAGYIACDPRDLAEVVLPCFENGSVWGVLDLDSFSRGAFNAEDALALNQLMQSFGLTDQDVHSGDVDTAG